MRSRKYSWIVAVVAFVVLLAPAILWSGKRTSDAVAQNGAAKMPEVSTIGPEMIPYRLTSLEREKLSNAKFVPSLPLDDLVTTEPKATIGSEGPYPGMTPAEIEKLAAYTGAFHNITLAVPEKVQAKSTIEPVPRPIGFEGLTPQERAKLKAYLESQNR